MPNTIVTQNCGTKLRRKEEESNCENYSNCEGNSYSDKLNCDQTNNSFKKIKLHQVNFWKIILKTQQIYEKYSEQPFLIL